MTTTLPGETEALRLAEVAIAERLAACAQIQGPIRSLFRWRGAVDQATEWYCHLKTTVERYPALADRIRSMHPYETPEIIAVPIVDGSAAYLGWVEGEVRADSPEAPRR